MITMANFYDVKRNYLLSQLGKTSGNTTDLEREFYLQELSLSDGNRGDLEDQFFESQDIDTTDPYFRWLYYLQAQGEL